MSLKGKVVAITRPMGQAEELASLVTKLGGRPYLAPTVEIRPARNLKPVEEFIRKAIARRLSFTIFMSQNGVIGLVEASEKLKSRPSLLRALKSTTVVAIGPETRKKLQSYGIKVSLTPPTFTSQGIAESLRSKVSGKTVALLRMKKATKYLKDELRKANAKIFEVPVYESTAPIDKSKVRLLIRDILNQKIDIITFTSSATALNLFKIANEQRLRTRLKDCLNENVTVVTIGPETQKTLDRMGVKVDVVPREYTTKDMFDTLIHHLNTRSFQ